MLVFQFFRSACDYFDGSSGENVANGSEKSISFATFISGRVTKKSSLVCFGQKPAREEVNLKQIEFIDFSAEFLLHFFGRKLRKKEIYRNMEFSCDKISIFFHAISILFG